MQIFSRCGFFCCLSLAQVGASLISSGCALRPRQDLSAYRVARHEHSHFLYPPGQRAGRVAPEQAVVEVTEFSASAPSAECSTADAVVALERGVRQAHTVARVRLNAQSADDAVPTSEENRAGQLRLAFQELEAKGCLRRDGGRGAALRAVESLPLPFAELLPYQYGFFRGGSVIDLRPESRLKIQRAFFRPEAGSSPGIGDYIGTTTSYYDVAGEGDGIILAPGNVESDVPHDSRAGQARTPALGPSPRKARYFRLAFLGLIVEGNTERTSALISAESYRDLERISERVLSNPEAPCATTAPQLAADCIEFGSAVSTEVELKVTVNGAPRFVGIGTPLRAMAPVVADGIDPAMQGKIKLLRRYGGRKARVRLDWDDPGALLLPLLAGDELSWQ